MRGSIRQRGNRSWEIRLFLGKDPQTGKKLYRSVTFHGNKKQAQAELARLVHQIETGQFLPPGKLTVAEFFEKWREYIRTRVSARTFVRYGQLLDHWIIPEIGSHALARLQPLHVQQLYSRALEGPRRDGRPGGLSPQSVVHIHRVLAEALKMAVRWGLAARNVCDAVEPPSPKRPEIRPLDEQEGALLLEAARGTRLYVPVLLALSCGLRRGEILAIQWRDIDWTAGTLYVRRSVEQPAGKATVAIKEPKSPRSRRAVALPPFVLEELRAHKAAQDTRAAELGPLWQDNGLICPREDGSLWVPSAFTSAYRDLLRRRGLNGPNFHALRHAHASQLIRAGLDVRTVAARLGHARPSTTLDVYSHLIAGQDQEAARRIDEAMRRALAGLRGLKN